MSQGKPQHLKICAPDTPQLCLVVPTVNHACSLVPLPILRPHHHGCNLELSTYHNVSPVLPPLCRFVRDVLQQLLQLLPSTPPTQLLLDSLADLDLPPEIVALQHQEADAVFRSSLGAHVTPKAFHHILQRWRQQHQGQWQQPSGQLDGTSNPGKLPASVQQWHWPVGQSDTAGVTPQRQQQQQLQEQQYSQAAPVEQAAAEADPGPTLQQLGPLLEQLAALTEVLGPEVVHAAVGSTPELLDADPAGVLANLQWLQQQLRLSPVAAVLMAETAGHVLLLPSSVLEARYSNVCYLLLQLLGWKLRQAHTLLCNAPQLLGFESARLASNWQLVQQLARSRSAWLEELANASPSLVVAVLSAEQRQLQQLRYAAEARELQGLGLAQVLRKEYVDFVHACPGFRVWRCLVPAERHRWSVVEAGCIVVPDPVLGAQDRRHLGKVLAADKRGQPVLVQVGDFSPSDRLLG